MEDYAQELLVGGALLVIAQLLGQFFINWRSFAKQGTIVAQQGVHMQNLMRNVEDFTGETRRRFESVESSLKGHTDLLNKHSGDIGKLQGFAQAKKGS